MYAYNKLLPPTPYAKRLGENGQFTSSSISFYWGMKQRINQLDVHNIFLAKEYQASFDDIFKRHLLPEDPSFYVNVPSRIDPSGKLIYGIWSVTVPISLLAHLFVSVQLVKSITAAPENKDTLVVLMPISHIAPNNVDRIDELVKSARANIIKIIETRLKISNFEELIETEIINDPRTWQSKFNLWKGSILGLSHNITQVLHMRPGTRSHLFKNLYFVGASAHPVHFKFCSPKII